jgi:hypothetical protein
VRVRTIFLHELKKSGNVLVPVLIHLFLSSLRTVCAQQSSTHTTREDATHHGRDEREDLVCLFRARNKRNIFSFFFSHRSKIFYFHFFAGVAGEIRGMGQTQNHFWGGDVPVELGVDDKVGAQGMPHRVQSGGTQQAKIDFSVSK